jgi:hypothetical protein
MIDPSAYRVAVWHGDMAESDFARLRAVLGQADASSY